MVAEAESSLEVSGDEETNINIKCSNGAKFSVKTSLESTVEEFKSVLAQNCEVPAPQQRLIYKGRIMKDEQTLASYGLQTGHSVHMVRGFMPSASPPSVPASAGNTNSHVTQGGGLVPGGTGVAGPGASLFPGLGSGALGGTGTSGFFRAGLPEFEQMQQQLTQNPNMLTDIMNTPVIQSLISNPENVRSLIMSNPRMHEILDQNPELGHVLNDPDTFRRTLEAAGNPEIIREMFQNTDRAMSNIESSREGFNMLRRTYENVQEPLMDAVSSPFTALLGNQAGAQIRDRSNPIAGSEPGTTVPNASPLPNPWSNTGTNPAGLGSITIPGLDPMDPSAFSQLSQNPDVSQISQSLLSNTQYLNQISSLAPQIAGLLDNPEFRELQNPETPRQSVSPELMQQMMALQQQLSQLAQQQFTSEGAQTAQETRNNTGLETLMNMFGGLGAGRFAAPNNPDVPLEQLYATQLSQLQEMGFYDTLENIRALCATSGNVHAAVDRLLGNLG